MRYTLGLDAAKFGAIQCRFARSVIICASAGAFVLTLPSVAIADDVNGAINTSSPVIGLRHHTVDRGEYLSDVARTFGVSVQALLTVNHLTSSNHIKAGAVLIIPAANSTESSLGTIPAPAAPAVRMERRLTLTFSSLDVRVVLDQISSYAHVDVLMTPGAKGIVSVNIRNRTADDAIRLVTAVAGLSVVRVGSAYVVGPTEEVSKAAGEFGQVDVVPLHWITPAEAAAGLGRLAPHVSVLPSKNGIIISGLPEDIVLAHSVLPSLDIEPAPAPTPRSESRVVTLLHVAPANAERIINDAYPNLKANLQDRTMILTGSAADLESAMKAVQGFDVQTMPEAEATEVLVYRLKYLNAQRTEETVKKAFPTIIVTVGPEPNAPPAAVFSPLNTIFGTGSGDFASTSSSSSTTSTTPTATATSGSGPQPLSRPTRIVLVGPKSQVAAARDMIEQTDLPQPSVRIEAVMLEVDRSDTQNLGITWDFTNTGFTFTEPAGNNVTFGTLQRSPASFSTSLQALFTQNKAKILASPNISVVDNEDASIFIGDMIRYLGGTISSPNVGTIQSVEALPVGIALLMRPSIHPDGSVTLKVHPVISTVTATVDGLPQTSSREADTTVRLMQGEQLVIGGLDRTDVTSVLNKVPILGDIPFLKEFFTTRTHSTDKTEVIIILRAYATMTEPAPAKDFRKGDPK